MVGTFQRWLVAYAEYHRDWRNCAMHVIGNPILFVAAVLPLSLLPVNVLGVQINAATLLVIPALIFWTVLDVAIGLALVAAAIPLLFAAATIAGQVNVLWVWVITAVLVVVGWTLQIVGHSWFEHRRPALLDNPVHMLISPMYVIAQLFITLGLRPDLATALQKASRPISGGSPLYSSRADPGE